MPIRDIDHGLRRVGKLRLGEQVETSAGKSRPAKLDTWRATSPDEEVVKAVAAVYGGAVRPWDNNGIAEFEVVTDAVALDVYLTPEADAFSQDYELWSGGGCQRRCDGLVEQLSGQSCLCPQDKDERQELAAKGKACKATTRLRVVLRGIPALGSWMVESHGYYAAKELGSTFDLLDLAGARKGLLPARLRIEQRVAKRDGKTNRYGVPVLDIARSIDDLLELGPPTGVNPATGEIGPAAPELPAAAPVTSPKQAAVRREKTLVEMSHAVKGGDPVSQVELDELKARIGAFDKQHRDLCAAALHGAELNIKVTATREQHAAAAQIVADVEAKQAATWEDRRKAVHAALGALNLDEKARHALILAATDGATESTKTLTQDQANAVLDAVEKRVDAAEDPGRPFEQPELAS